MNRPITMHLADPEAAVKLAEAIRLEFAPVADLKAWGVYRPAVVSGINGSVHRSAVSGRPSGRPMPAHELHVCYDPHSERLRCIRGKVYVQVPLTYLGTVYYNRRTRVYTAHGALLGDVLDELTDIFAHLGMVVRYRTEADAPVTGEMDLS